MNSSFESLIEQYPLPIAEQLRHWAARYASRIAVVDAKGSLTYSALDAQVDLPQVCHHWVCVRGSM